MCDVIHSYVWRVQYMCDIIIEVHPYLPISTRISLFHENFSFPWDSLFSMRIFLFHENLFVTLLIHLCGMTHPYAWKASFIWVTWLIHVRVMTHSYVWHDSSMCVTWLIHMCDMTHPCAWHDSFICVTWLIHMCDMTHPCAWHDSFICVTCCMLYAIIHCIIHCITYKSLNYCILYAIICIQDTACHTYEWWFIASHMHRCTLTQESCHMGSCLRVWCVWVCVCVGVWVCGCAGVWYMCMSVQAS